jgi:DNA-binding Xre family transcriptional regulator
MPTEIPPEGLVLCNLNRIMDERRLTVAETSRLSNLSRPTIRKLRDDPCSVVDTATVAKLCHALKLGVGVLFVHVSQGSLQSNELGH